MNDHRDTDFDDLHPDSEAPTGITHVIPTEPPGADGAVPPAVGRDLGAAIDGIHQARRDFANGVLMVNEAAQRIEQGFKQIAEVIETVQRHEEFHREHARRIDEVVRRLDAAGVPPAPPPTT